MRLGLFKKIVKFTVIVNYKQDTKINDILFYKNLMSYLF